MESHNNIVSLKNGGNETEIFIGLGSTLRGLLAMEKKQWSENPKWSIRRIKRGLWFTLWTPIWHDGRGPYVSIGLGVIAIYRGY